MSEDTIEVLQIAPCTRAAKVPKPTPEKLKDRIRTLYERIPGAWSIEHDPNLELSMSQDISKSRAKYEKQIIGSFEKFKKISGGNKQLTIDTEKLACILQSWLDDLGRYEFFYGVDGSDRYKQVAFLINRIVKARLISFNFADNSKNKFYNKYNMVNEQFALILGLNVLGGIEYEELNPELREQLIFTLQRRNIDPEHLFLMLKLIFDNAQIFKQLKKIVDNCSKLED